MGRRPVGARAIRLLDSAPLQRLPERRPLVATTSLFTSDAKAYQQEVQTRLNLRDYFDLQTLLRDAAKRRRGPDAA